LLFLFYQEFDIQMAEFDLSAEDSREGFNNMMAMLGPGQIDQAIRQAIQTCWMMLPDDKKTMDELESKIRHVFERAIANFREDFETFSPSPKP
jgi:hypothetical protein